MSNVKIEVTWIDRWREPQCPSNPLYPDGIDIDLSRGALACCTQRLPYPARRCGVYYVECKTCGANAMVTTAGRRDDPRSVKLECHRTGVPQ